MIYSIEESRYFKSTIHVLWCLKHNINFQTGTKAEQCPGIHVLTSWGGSPEEDY